MSALLCKTFIPAYTADKVTCTRLSTVAKVAPLTYEDLAEAQ